MCTFTEEVFNGKLRFLCSDSKLIYPVTKENSSIRYYVVYFLVWYMMLIWQSAMMVETK